MSFTWFLFSFKGRINRLPHNVFQLGVLLVFGFPLGVMSGQGFKEAEMIMNVINILLLWPALAVQVKRWHDRDKSGWWVLINIIPIIGFIWAFVVTCCLPGTKGDNRFGPDSLVTEASAKSTSQSNQIGKTTN